MRHKYNAKRTLRDGVLFDSKREAERYGELMLLARAGVIRNLRLQPKYTLQEAFTDSTGERHRGIVYQADFAYEENGRACVEEVKGYDKNRVWLIKQKMFLYRYRDLELRIVK